MDSQGLPFIQSGVVHPQLFWANSYYIYTEYTYIYIYSYGRNYLFFGKCHHQRWGGVPYRFCQLFHIGVSVFGGSLSIFEGSLSRLKVQGNFLRLCSSTSFVGYSCIHIRCLCVFGRETKHPNIVRARLGQFLLRS